jgi:hypothetical protein
MLLDFIYLLIPDDGYKSWRFHYDPFSILTVLIPNIILRTRFPNTRSLCNSLRVKAQVSCRYKTYETIVVFFRVVLFLGRPKDKRFGTEWHKAFPEFHLVRRSSRT